MIKDAPTLFSLLVKFSPIARQKFGERRREMKKTAEERLVKGSDGSWRLEYWKNRKKIGELPLA